MTSRYLQIALFAAMTLCPADVRASFVLYDSRSVFDAAVPGLPIETFESAAPRVSSPTGDAVTGPVNSLTNNAYFAPGDVLPGLSVDVASHNLVVGNTGRSPSVLVMNNSEGEPITVWFAPRVTAVGLDLVGLFTENGLGDMIAYDADGNVIATVPIAPPGSGQFFGITSTVPIDHLTFGNHIAWYGFDNIAFGDPVPEPSTLACLMLGLLTLSASHRRK